MDDLNKVNISSLKNLLRANISIFEEKQKEKDNNSYLLGIYNDILSLINQKSAEEIMQNFVNFVLISLIYNDKMANEISKDIYQTSYLISLYSKNNVYEKELLKAQDKLKKIIRKIMDEYEIIYNKNKVYINEINKLSNRIYVEKGILYRLNTKKNLGKFQIEEIKKILNENNWSEDKQIILSEYIRNYNIKCNYDNPKISYTTINMLQNDFEFYNTEDLIDIEVKNKLDNHVNTMFETLFLEEDIELESFLNSYTTWMNNEEYNYTIESILNKFTSELKKCQNEMVQNYEDIELRKIVIEDYNHYYHKYLRFKKYYQESLNQVVEDNKKEEIKMMDNENNLFYAMSKENSYIEKDIEDVPEEYLERVKKLLEGFKNNTLIERKIEGFSANGKLKEYKKLKDDQVRIVFRKINKNNYLILGLMIKKENRATKDYVSIVKRDYKYDIDDEFVYNNKLNESNIIYNNLIDYIESNSRKGNR